MRGNPFKLIDHPEDDAPQPPRGSIIRNPESASTLHREPDAPLPQTRDQWCDLARRFLDGQGPTEAEIRTWSVDDRRRLLHAVDLILPARYGWTREHYERLCRDARYVGILLANIPATPEGPDGQERVDPDRYERWDIKITTADKLDLPRLARAHRVAGNHIVRAIMGLMLAYYARPERDRLLGCEA